MTIWERYATPEEKAQHAEFQAMAAAGIKGARAIRQRCLTRHRRAKQSEGKE